MICHKLSNVIFSFMRMNITPQNNIQTRGSFLKLKCPFRKNQRRSNGVVLRWSNHMEQNP